MAVAGGVILEPVATVQSISEKNGIRIVTMRDLYKEKRLPFPSDFQKSPYSSLIISDTPTAWNPAQLAVLNDCLDNLPDHFTVPNAAGEPLELALSYQDCVCPSTFDEKMPHRIEFSYDRFSNSTKREDLAVVAHELTHIITPIEGEYLEYSEIFGRQVSIENSPWIDTITEVVQASDQFEARAMLGSRYRKLKQPLTGKLPRLGFLSPEQQKQKIKQTLTPEEQEQYYFLERFGNTLSSPLRPIHEVIAQLSENYVKGTPYFERNYRRVFSADEFKQIFDFTKTEIFRGREYSRHPFDIQTH